MRVERRSRATYELSKVPCPGLIAELQSLTERLSVVDVVFLSKGQQSLLCFFGASVWGCETALLMGARVAGGGGTDGNPRVGISYLAAIFSWVVRVQKLLPHNLRILSNGTF